MASVEGCSLALSSMESARSEFDLAALVETYSSLLFRVAHSVLRSRAEAEDVVQDVFVRVLEHRRSLATVRELRVWLVRIAWNLALDRRRRIRPEQFDEGFAESLVGRNLPADEALNEAQRLRAVLRELERLPKAERSGTSSAGAASAGTNAATSNAGEVCSGSINYAASNTTADENGRERMKMNCDAGVSRSMKFAGGILGMALALALMGPSAWGQAGESTIATEKANTASRQDLSATARVDSRPFQTFYLSNVSGQNDANEVTVALRNLLPPDVKIFLVPNQNAITMRGTPDQLALAQKIISDLDRLRKTYRLIYTIVEMDGGKRVGVQHFAMIVTPGQRAVLKQGSRMPIATGSYGASGNTGAQTQVTYVDVGMNFDATMDELANGARLRSKVEQLSIAEQTPGVGVANPIIRQTALEGTSFLTLGKPLVLGSIDIPGSTRHLDVEVAMERVSQ